MMNAEEYLNRIHYTGELRPSLKVLSALQESHLLAVPFENLDIHTGTKIVLDLPRLFTKIVSMKRGGFCYELNGLFHWLLAELGFRVKLAMGRAYDRNRAAFGPDFDHMLILAEVDSRAWLVDVGFGDFSIRPLELVLNQPSQDRNGLFLIEQENPGFLRVSRYSRKEGGYVPEYLFSEVERRLEDFSEMCLYHQTSPVSHFTRNRVCSIATGTGRITLTDNRLIVTDGKTRGESIIHDQQEFGRALAQHFGLVIPGRD